MASKLIGRKVHIKSSIDSPYAGQWGIVRGFNGEDYFVAIWDSQDQMIFWRNDFTVAK